MTSDEITNKLSEIGNLKFIKPYFKTDFTAYFHFNNAEINIRLAYRLNSGDTYWYKIIPSTSYQKRLSFEQVLDLVSDDIKTELLFNIDLFR